MRKNISIIGSQMDMGSFRKGVDMGPLAIRHAGLIQKIRDIGYHVVDHGDIMPMVAEEEGNPRLRYEKEINEANGRLYDEVLKSCKDGNFPVILGGDHSIAAGSISATLTAYENIGIVWVDAHGDFNDEAITPSGNMHGMPLSAVCGKGPDSMVAFSSVRANPKNVVVIGARSIDPLEKIKLQENGVTIISISQIHSLGIREMIAKAISVASEGTNGIHLSFDMDALDPMQAPGVGTPVLNGLTQREAFFICEELYKSGKLLAIDVVETNPLLDKRNMTGVLATELILSCLGSTEYDLYTGSVLYPDI
ncbi:MAG: arginase [Lachnospiraceae bacterium]|nr:arginase [Lachnospiraceae bacterium]